MSEQTGPDGENPVQPPRFGEVPSAPPPPPPPPPPPRPDEQTGPPTEPRPPQPVGAPPPGSSAGDDKKKGTVVALLVALGVVIAGTVGFVVTRPDDSEPPSSNAAPVAPDPLVTTTDPESTTTESTTPDSSTSEATTTVGAAAGSVDGVFVRVDARAELVSDADLDATLQRIGLASGDNPVSTAEPVVNLCAALPVDGPLSARVEWRRNNVTILDNPTRPLAAPADGACINNDGDPLESGVYEVFFTDDAGGESLVSLFTVGATTRSQVFLNDTGTEICLIDLSPTDAGFYQSFEPVGDPASLADGDTITIAVADVEHDLKPVDCDGNELGEVFFTPSDEPVSMSSGLTGPPTTVPPPQITDDELSKIDGVVGSFELAVEPGSTDEAALISELTAPGPPLPIASTDRSLTLCSAWAVGGSFAGDAVWEFNGEDFARRPAQIVDGFAVSCIPPNGVDEFGEGAYQVFLERDGASSTVQTYTVGRDQTQLAFVNDTGVEICAVGFSPTLTTYYTYYSFADAADFDGALPPGDSFTIFAPFIENDIQARDCDDNVVAESLAIAPTDQTLNLSTGQP